MGLIELRVLDSSLNYHQSTRWFPNLSSKTKLYTSFSTIWEKLTEVIIVGFKIGKYLEGQLLVTSFTGLKVINLLHKERI